MKKRFISAFLACVMATGTFGGISALGEEKEMNVSSVLTENIVYVSQEGKSGATGSKSDPFRAIYEAQEYLREKELSEENRGIIYLREGTYNVTESIEITEADSYITLSAYADERVEITGSAELENAKFKKLSEAEGGQFSSKARLQSGVKDKIYVYDMGSEGMSVGEIYKNGFNWKKLPLAPELVVDEKMQTLARYPNEDNIFLTNAEMGKVSGGTNVRNYFFDKTDEPKTYEEMLGMDGPILSIKALPDRAKKWAAPYGNETYSAVSGLQPEINVNSDNTLYETDGWIRGRVGNDYSDDNLKMYSVKNDSGTYKIYFKYPSLYGVMNGFKVQAINLLCELDTPGEYYIDRFGGNNVLYYYPEDGEIDGKSIKITALDKNLVYMNGAKGVRLNNIIFTGTTNSGIQMTDCEDCVVSDCEFYNILMDAIRIGANNDAITCDPSYETWGGGHDNLVTNCSIHDMGHGGVYVSGGDCKSLERGDNIVENCEIYNFSRLATYTPGIYLEGVGHTARNNYLHDAPHMMLQIMGNDMLVTHNRFVNSAYNSNDQTPIYIGRNWMWMGNEICYNYIDNVHWENSTNFNFGIYMDDNTAGVMIHHNLFHQVGGNAFYSNTGYLMYVTDNIVVETTGPYFRFRTEGDAKWARPIVNEKPLKYRFFDIMRTREEAIASGDEDNEYTKGYWNTQENIDKYIKHYNELYNNLPEFSKKEKYAFDLSKKYFPAEGDASARVWTDRNNVMTIADVTIVRNITVDSGDLWNLGGFYNNDISAVTDPDTFDIKRHRADSTDDLGLDLETGKIDKGSSLLYDENFGEEWVKEWNESFTAAEAGLLPKVKKHRLWNKIGEAEAIENKSGGLKSAIEKAHAAATCYEATQADIDNSTALLMNELEEYAPQYDLSEYSLNMEIGDRAILSVINLKEGDKVLWSSSNEAVAGVEEGVVTALSGGTSQISAKIGETEVSCTVTVKDLVLTISRENAVLNLSDVTSVNLKATGVPEGVEVCWTTSDEAVARVENGTITATGAGEAVITAETCGKELYCNVRVLDIEISDDELAMHFKADEGTVTDEDDNLSKWENLAPSGGSALQSTQGKQPKLIEDISGRKYLQFDGTDDYLQMTTSYNFKGRNEATIIVVSESEEGTITKDNGDY
ncbi:MAG: right-handed parallel beta-helix repeat-containing protein, partial [Clostridia bacterium]|nr:right-handed parallel beta-helix repeat-containing protein [Clostridia bacterium]